MVFPGFSARNPPQPIAKPTGKLRLCRLLLQEQRRGAFEAVPSNCRGGEAAKGEAESKGKIMGKSWKMVEMIWENDGKIMGKSWKMVEMIWENDHDGKILWNGNQNMLGIMIVLGNTIQWESKQCLESW